MKYCLTKLNILLPICEITSIHWVLFQNNVCEVITHLYQTGRRIYKYAYNSHNQELTVKEQTSLIYSAKFL